MYSLTRLCVQRTSLYSKNVLRQEKRFAGHSKWQNIKHVKAEKDAEKGQLISLYVRRMKIAIAEGKSHKPLENLRLAQIIDEAKRKCVPAATIAGVLERAEKTKTKTHAELVDFRGPGKSIFVVKVLSDNVLGIKMQLNTILRKTKCTPGEGKLRGIFERRGVVMTEANGSLDAATDDAIAVGAEDVEEFEENGKFYRFICDPQFIPKVVTQLKSLNYNVVSADEEFNPVTTVTITEEESKLVDSLYKKLNAIEEIVSVNHNIDFSEEEEQAASKS